jgi:hypothetical protein
MKNVIRLIMLFSGILSFGSLRAQTADDIINKHIDAIGGRDVISKINSIYEEATLSVMGNDAPDTIYILSGKGYKTMTQFNGQEIIQCYTDSGGWTINPMGGSGAPTPISAEEARAVKGEIYIGGTLANYSSMGGKAELQGTEKVGDATAYKILLTMDSSQTTYYIDTVTYYVVKQSTMREMQGNQVNVDITFSNYKKTDSGYVIPYGMNMDFGQFTLSYTVSKVEINIPIDPSIFKMPTS